MQSRAVLFLLAAGAALAQSDTRQIRDILDQEILAPQVAAWQLRHYLLGRVAEPPKPDSAEIWTGEARRIRERLLRDVVFHGWPAEWVNSPPRFEQTGVIEGRGYRMRKLRYEIVPGFWSAAILYEPDKLTGKIPAILNVNGHVGPPGKSVEYKQKRCINFALRGMLALNLEWFAFGELNRKENLHAFGAHLDLVGMNEVGLFYLAMRRGLDYLYEHPNTDRARIGMTGLSGGGWQTITLSSLDERIRVSVPVAGFSSLRSRIEARRYGDVGDIEQAATDFLVGVDFTHLVGLMAPRPTLLVYNAEDDCCFRAPMVKPFVFDAIRPVFALYGKPDALGWHENRDPGTHNYQLDNRLAAYRFFSRHFGMKEIDGEIPVDDQVRSYDDLVVGLPDNNLTILGLAKQTVDRIVRESASDDAARERLRQVVRYRPARAARIWTVANTKNHGVESKSHVFEMDNGLSATAVWLKSIETTEGRPLTILLDDRGKGNTASPTSERVNRGDQVLAVDLAFNGEAWRNSGEWMYEQMLHGTGDRPLGLEAAQLIEIAKQMRARAGGQPLRVETSGIRSQTIAWVAAALEPGLFSAVVSRDAMASLRHLLDKPVEFREAPDLFCLDLFKQFDLDRLASLAKPASLSRVGP